MTENETQTVRNSLAAVRVAALAMVDRLDELCGLVDFCVKRDAAQSRSLPVARLPLPRLPSDGAAFNLADASGLPGDPGVAVTTEGEVNDGV